MSHFTKLKSKLTNEAALVEALKDLGFTTEQIEIHEKPAQLEGYDGRMRNEKANVVIRRKHVGSSMNDMGFLKQKDGTYEAIISDYNAGWGNAGKKNELTKKCKGYDKRWMDLLHQRHTYHTVKQFADEYADSVEEEYEQDTLKLTITLY